MLEAIGWGTWIRTKINGVRVRCSTVELSPKRRRAERARTAGDLESAADSVNLPAANAAARALMAAGNALAGGAPILYVRNLRQPSGVTMIAAPLPSMRRKARRSGIAEGIE